MKETYFEMVSRLNAGCFLDFRESLKARDVRPKKADKLLRAAEKLSAEQLKALQAVIAGKLTWEGVEYSLTREADCWRLQRQGSVEHTVDSSLEVCSCSDAKFRDHQCKHILMLKEYLTCGTS